MTFTQFLAEGGWLVVLFAVILLAAIFAALHYQAEYANEKKVHEYDRARHADLYESFVRLQADYDKAIKLGASAKLDAMWNATAARNQEKEVGRWKDAWERMADRHGDAHARAEELQCKLDLERKRVTDLINYLTGAV